MRCMILYLHTQPHLGVYGAKSEHSEEPFAKLLSARCLVLGPLCLTIRRGLTVSMAACRSSSLGSVIMYA